MICYPHFVHIHLPTHPIKGWGFWHLGFFTRQMNGPLIYLALTPCSVTTLVLEAMSSCATHFPLICCRRQHSCRNVCAHAGLLPTRHWTEQKSAHWIRFMQTLDDILFLQFNGFVRWRPECGLVLCTVRSLGVFPAHLGLERFAAFSARPLDSWQPHKNCLDETFVWRPHEYCFCRT